MNCGQPGSELACLLSIQTCQRTLERAPHGVALAAQSWLRGSWRQLEHGFLPRDMGRVFGKIV